MDNNLYNEYASYYAAITNDRDIEGQLNCILDTFDPQYPCESVLELFAGQAWHSIFAQKRNINAWAADASMGMKGLAISDGFQKTEQYIVGALPSSILDTNDLPKFDLVLCLYHGLSNLTRPQVYELLDNLKLLIKPHGKVVIELHNIHYAMRYVAEPLIKFFEVTGRAGEIITYAWPGGKIVWSPESHTAEVPITCIVRDGKKVQKLDFTSIDHLYSAEDISFMANLLGYVVRVRSNDYNWQKQFDNSVVLELTLR